MRQLHNIVQYLDCNSQKEDKKSPDVLWTFEKLANIIWRCIEDLLFEVIDENVQFCDRVTDKLGLPAILLFIKIIFYRQHNMITKKKVGFASEETKQIKDTGRKTLSASEKHSILSNKHVWSFVSTSLKCCIHAIFKQNKTEFRAPFIQIVQPTLTLDTMRLMINTVGEKDVSSVEESLDVAKGFYTNVLTQLLSEDGIGVEVSKIVVAAVELLEHGDLETYMQYVIEVRVYHRYIFSHAHSKYLVPQSNCFCQCLFDARFRHCCFGWYIVQLSYIPLL